MYVFRREEWLWPTCHQWKNLDKDDLARVCTVQAPRARSLADLVRVWLVSRRVQARWHCAWRFYAEPHQGAPSRCARRVRVVCAAESESVGDVEGESGGVHCPCVRCTRAAWGGPRYV